MLPTLVAPRIAGRVRLADGHYGVQTQQKSFTARGCVIALFSTSSHSCSDALGTNHGGRLQ